MTMITNMIYLHRYEKEKTNSLKYREYVKPSKNIEYITMMPIFRRGDCFDDEMKSMIQEIVTWNLG